MDNINCATAVSTAHSWIDKNFGFKVTYPETFEELSPSDMEEIMSFFTTGRYSKLEAVKLFFETRFNDQKFSRTIGGSTIGGIRNNEFYVLRTYDRKYVFELKRVYHFEKGRQEFKSVYSYTSGGSEAKRELPIYNRYNLIGYVECEGYCVAYGKSSRFKTKPKNNYQLDETNLFGWDEDGQIIFIPISWKIRFDGEFYHEDGEKAIAEKITEEQYKNILDAFDLFKLKI